MLPVALLLVLSTAVGGYRLPTFYSPSFYEISLVLPDEIFNVENATAYTGRVAITFNVSASNVSQVVLHASASQINVTSASLSSANVTGYSVNSTTDILTVSLNSTLSITEEHVLTLIFGKFLL